MWRDNHYAAIMSANLKNPFTPCIPTRETKVPDQPLRPLTFPHHRNEFLEAEPSTSLAIGPWRAKHLPTRWLSASWGLTERAAKWNSTTEIYLGYSDIDHKTSRLICDEVGKRLQQDLSLDDSPLPPYLDRLIDEYRKRDT